KKRSSAVLGLYPHDLHPGLVPGISVEEQRNTFGIDKIVFSVTAIFIVAFIAWGISSPESVASVSSTAYAWAMNNVLATQSSYGLGPVRNALPCILTVWKYSTWQG